MLTVHTQDNGENVDTVRVGKIHQTSWETHKGKNQINRHTREHDFKIKQEVNKHYRQNLILELRT